MSHDKNDAVRRDFVKAATASGTRSGIPISLQMYALRDYRAREGFDRLKQIADIGFKGIELAGFEGYQPGELRTVLDDLGLKATGKFIGGRVPDDLNETVEHAKVLGFSFVAVTFGPDDWKTTDDIKRNAEEVQRAAEWLAPHGIQLLYHNHFWEFAMLDGKLPYETFFTLAPAVASLIDIYYAQNFGKVDAPQIVKKWAPRIPAMHIKDGPLLRDQNQVAVGEGKMDVTSCLKAADPRVLQWAVVDLETCDGDMMDTIARSYKYLVGTGLVAGNR